MRKIDWHYLQQPLIYLVLSVAIAASLGVVGFQYEVAQVEKYEKALANLRTTQQTIISKFLFHNFGHRIVVPQRQLAAYRSSYVEYETFTEIFGGKKVSYSFRDVSKLFKFYLP